MYDYMSMFYIVLITLNYNQLSPPPLYKKKKSLGFNYFFIT